jgi:hypothetical protein
LQKTSRSRGRFGTENIVKIIQGICRCGGSIKDADSVLEFPTKSSPLLSQSPLLSSPSPKTTHPCIRRPCNFPSPLSHSLLPSSVSKLVKSSFSPVYAHAVVPRRKTSRTLAAMSAPTPLAVSHHGLRKRPHLGPILIMNVYFFSRFLGSSSQRVQR